MSFNDNMKKITGVPKFNGDSEKFPIFSIKFEGLMFRLGSQYTNALQGRAPYKDYEYRQEFKREQFQTYESSRTSTSSSSSSSTSSSSTPSAQDDQVINLSDPIKSL